MSGDRIAGVLTFNFDYGLNQLWQTLYTGASLHLHDFILPNDLFRFLAGRRITTLPLMPVLISRMFERRFASLASSERGSSLRTITSSGGPVSETMLRHLRGTFPRADIVLMYGLTEAFRSTYLSPAELVRRPGSVGKAIPEVEILVLDEAGRDCPPGVAGELVHRGGCVALGYWNAPEETARRFRRIERFPGETVVFSGDLVKTDEDGYLYFVARKDGMIKTHGFRVSPTEVEVEVCRYPGVGAAVAFGVPSAEVGEEIAVVYTTADGAPRGEAELRRHLRDALPHYMVPRWLLFVEEFPATGNEGKVDRQTAILRAKERLVLNRASERSASAG